MTAHEFARQLVQTLPSNVPGLFNPWVDRCPDDTELNDAAARLQRLAQHLDVEAQFILVGEASGHLGMRRSALAFSSEKQVIEGLIPRVPGGAGRLTTRRLPFAEPSATLVWKALRAAGIAEVTAMWNAVPLHPHQPGDPNSNRTPTREELSLGVPAMKLLTARFPTAKVIAVGKKAVGLLQDLGIPTVGAVRHPANGGAAAFAAGMAEIARAS